MPIIKAILLALAISALASSANGRKLLPAEENPNEGEMETTFYHGHYFPPYGWPYGGGLGGRFGSIGFGPGLGGSMGGGVGPGGGGTGGEIGTGGIGSEKSGSRRGDNGSIVGVGKGAVKTPGGVEGGMH